MARTVVVGGSGHVGTYLVPMLVAKGHEVINVSRGKASPYCPDPVWRQVRIVEADRTAEDAAGTFGARIAALNADIVIDMISFDLPSTRQIVEALRGRVEHFFHCGTIWVYGQNTSVPATEDDPLDTFGEYGVQKAAIETWLLHEARRTGFPATVFRPGHIVGPGWVPINPVGNVDPEVFSCIARGEELALPNFGLETVHHVHAADVAQLVMCAIVNRHAAVGETFNAVSPQAINLRGYAESMFRWFGHEPKLRFQSFEEWKKDQTPEFALHSWEHIIRSSCHSIEKARTRLNYAPRYSSLEAVKESVAALIAAGKIETPRAWTKA